MRVSRCFAVPHTSLRARPNAVLFLENMHKSRSLACADGRGLKCVCEFRHNVANNVFQRGIYVDTRGVFAAFHLQAATSIGAVELETFLL